MVKVDKSLMNEKSKMPIGFINVEFLGKLKKCNFCGVEGQKSSDFSGLRK